MEIIPLLAQQKPERLKRPQAGVQPPTEHVAKRKPRGGDTTLYRPYRALFNSCNYIPGAYTPVYILSPLWGCAILV